jgi:hypothetical protein
VRAILADVKCAEPKFICVLHRRHSDKREFRVGEPVPDRKIFGSDGDSAEPEHVSAGFGHPSDFLPCDFSIARCTPYGERSPANLSGGDISHDRLTGGDRRRDRRLGRRSGLRRRLLPHGQLQHGYALTLAELRHQYVAPIRKLDRIMMTMRNTRLDCA